MVVLKNSGFTRNRFLSGLKFKIAKLGTLNYRNWDMLTIYFDANINDHHLNLGCAHSLNQYIERRRAYAKSRKHELQSLTASNQLFLKPNTINNIKLTEKTTHAIRLKISKYCLWFINGR